MVVYYSICYVYYSIAERDTLILILIAEHISSLKIC